MVGHLSIPGDPMKLSLCLAALTTCFPVNIPATQMHDQNLQLFASFSQKIHTLFHRFSYTRIVELTQYDEFSGILQYYL